MKKVIILRYSEIWLKGKNRGFFERALETNLARAIKDFSCELVKQSGRYIVRDFEDEQAEEILEKLKKVFGIHSLSVALETSSDMDSRSENSVSASGRPETTARTTPPQFTASDAAANAFAPPTSD